MEDKEFSKKVRALKRLKVKKKALQTEMQALESDIKKEMESRGVEELLLSNTTIRYQSITIQRFDTTAFKLTHKDLYAQYTKPSITKRLTIS